MRTQRKIVRDDRFRSYEEDILKDFKSLAVLTGHGGRSTSRKGRWIRGYLLDQERLGKVEGDYVLNVQRKWKDFVTKAKALRKLDLGDGGTYQATRQYFWILAKCGLIRKTKREKPKRGGGIMLQRQYYIVVRKMVDSPIWSNPYKVYEA